MKWLSGLFERRAEKDDPLTDEMVAAAHQQRLRQALDDASLLIAFASESKRASDPEVLSTLIKAKLQYQEDKSLAKNAEADFWNAFSTLSTAVQPATVAGIRNGAKNKDLGFVGWMIKYPWISVPATVALLLFIILQIYTVRGAHLLKQFDDFNSEFAKSQQTVLLLSVGDPVSPQEESESTEGVAPAGEAPAGAMPAQEMPEKAPPKSPERLAAEGNHKVHKANLDKYRVLLADWNSCTILSIFLLCPPLDAKVHGTGNSKSMAVGGSADVVVDPGVDLNAVRAEMRLNNLNASILPMILGLLGACTSVLRSISRRVIDQSMNTTFLPAYYVRIVLGMIIGATIGLFLLPSPNPDAENLFDFLTNLPLLTAAFLAGYAAEVFFALLDRIVGDARNYVAGGKEEPTK